MRGAVLLVTSYGRGGRLIPRNSRGLRAGSVILRHGRVMEWHSTRAREELLIALRGTVRVEVRVAPRRIRSTKLRAGQCALLPRRTVHRVVNRSRAASHYLYITAPACHEKNHRCNQ